MNATEFNALPLDARAEYQWDCGRFIISRHSPDLVRSLYAVDAFYVEVIYDRKRKALADVIGFDNPKKLSEYLEGVSIEKLL